MVLSVQRGAPQYILETPLKERLFRYFKQKTLNCPHIKKSSIFHYQSDLLGCSFSVPGCFNKFPALFLQIQRVFKRKVIFKEFSRTEQFFQACANHVYMNQESGFKAIIRKGKHSVKLNWPQLLKQWIAVITG